MKYAYENLSPDQFESLVLLICKKLLGISAQGFAKGPDGGRDGKFVGTAELHPSKAEPWKGTVIIQAKHTSATNSSFSDLDFFSPNNSKSTIRQEALKVKNLRNNSNLDHYMLFSNRKLTGKAQEVIIKYLSEECDLAKQSIYLAGIEQIEMYLKEFPDIPNKANIDPIDGPLIIDPDDLSEIIEAFSQFIETLNYEEKNSEISRISYKEKNKLNSMSDEFAEELRKKYLKHTLQIQSFLAEPENINLLKKYENTVDDFQQKIIAHQKDYQSFDRIFNYLCDILIGRDPILARNKPLTKAFLFYMYYHCDIGRSK